MALIPIGGREVRLTSPDRVVFPGPGITKREVVHYYRDVADALLGVLREAGWNVHEMENVVFAGAEAACARIRFDAAGADGPTPDDAALDRVRAVEHVINATTIPV